TIAIPPPADVQRNAGSRSRRINDSLKPAVLSKDASPTELRHWIDSFKAYYSSNDMDDFSKEERRSYFKILLDSDLKTRIMAKMNDTTDVFGEDGCIQLLENDFLGRYPLFSRRLDFFQYQQKNGQAFTDFVAKSKELSRLADLEKLSVEEIFVFCLLRGTTDSALLDDLLELPEKTLKNVENTGKMYESKLISRSKLNANLNEPVLKVTSQYQRRNQVKPKPRQDQDRFERRMPTSQKHPTTIREMKERGICTRCGKGNHIANECSYERNVICNHCGIKGHIAPACLSRVKVNAVQAERPNDRPRNTDRPRDPSPSASSVSD
ncbi:hypothetical protein COA94_08935, partial, partial [Paramuricea clavata]